MKELVCNYALIRFLPYRETGEFVNIGVVVYAPEVHSFGFRLAERKNKRVRAFFPEMDGRVYSTAVESMRQELARQRERFTAMGGLFAGDRGVGEGLTAFRSMLRRRESLLHFAEPGMRLGVPAETLEALYAEYVLRSFAQTPAYQETVMRRRLGGWLQEWGVGKQYLHNRRVGDGMYSVALPFVHFEEGVARVAIKPLDLDRNEPTEVYEHGGAWAQRFGRLAGRGHLPGRMVVPVLLPAGKAREAADEILKEMEAVGVKTAEFNDVGRVRELTRV